MLARSPDVSAPELGAWEESAPENAEATQRPAVAAAVISVENVWADPVVGAYKYHIPAPIPPTCVFVIVTMLLAPNVAIPWALAVPVVRQRYMTTKRSVVALHVKLNVAGSVATVPVDVLTSAIATYATPPRRTRAR